jgi:hypothetical protein
VSTGWSNSFVALTFTKCPVGRCLLSMRNQLADGGVWRFSTAESSTSEVTVGLPQRGGALPIRAILWEPLSLPGWTAVAPNVSDGWWRLISRVATRDWEKTVSIRSTLPVHASQVQEVIYYAHNEQPTTWQAIEDDGDWDIFLENPSVEWKGIVDGKLPHRGLVEQIAALYGIVVANVDLWRAVGDITYIDEVLLP